MGLRYTDTLCGSGRLAQALGAMFEVVRNCRLAASELNLNKRRFALTLEPPEGSAFTVSFEGIAAHYLQAHDLHTILQSIEETKPEDLIAENWQRIIACWQSGEWLGPEPEVPADATAFVKLSNLRGYNLIATSGQIGW